MSNFATHFLIGRNVAHRRRYVLPEPMTDPPWIRAPMAGRGPPFGPGPP